MASGLSAGQLLAALPGALAGLPLGIGLFAIANGAGIITFPPAAWLLAAALAAITATARVALVPAGISARHPIADVLRAEYT